MELLKKIFDLSITQEFIARCESVAQQNPAVINNGIGVNFSKTGIESIKFYYGFHHKLNKLDVEAMHLYGSTDTFYKMEELLNESDYIFHPYYPTGVSFALKIDKSLKSAIGHFMMPKIESNDMFFTLKKVVEHYKTNNHLPILDRKGVFTMINSSGIEHQKDYFYVTDKEFKRKIGTDFAVNTDIVPSIEWVIGKGFYSGSSPDDEKIVLQSNYSEVYNEIIKNEKNPTIIEFNQFMFKHFNAYCVCPGFYKDKDIRSYYYFNGKLTNPQVIDTISKIQLNIKLI
ncbi:MAG: hypothetical protein H6588_08180 [Flavobacteriales bacterium]|nr:hypothetical protein [Flavobacteriales bacterium]